MPKANKVGWREVSGGWAASYPVVPSLMSPTYVIFPGQRVVGNVQVADTIADSSGHYVCTPPGGLYVAQTTTRTLSRGESKINAVIC